MVLTQEWQLGLKNINPTQTIRFESYSTRTLHREADNYSGVRGCSGLRKIWSCIFGRFSSKNYYGKPYSNRNFGFFGCRIFKNRKNLGEKIEKMKIASNHFKDCPWATQSPNMSSQLPLGPEIIAGEIWSRKSGNLDRIWAIFNGDPIESGPEPPSPLKNSDFKSPQL